MSSLFLRRPVSSAKASWTTFNDVVIDTLRDKVSGPRGDTIWPVLMETVKIVYSGTAKGSKLRTLFINLFQFHAASLGQYNEEEIPKEFLFDVAQALMERMARTSIGGFGGEWAPICEYHSHGEDGKCYLVKG